MCSDIPIPPIPSYPDIFSYAQSDFPIVQLGGGEGAGEILCGDFMLEFPLYPSNNPPSLPEQFMPV